MSRCASQSVRSSTTTLHLSFVLAPSFCMKAELLVENLVQRIRGRNERLDSANLEAHTAALRLEIRSRFLPSSSSGSRALIMSHDGRIRSRVDGACAVLLMIAEASTSLAVLCWDARHRAVRTSMV